MWALGEPTPLRAGEICTRPPACPSPRLLSLALPSNLFSLGGLVRMFFLQFVRHPASPARGSLPQPAVLTPIPCPCHRALSQQPHPALVWVPRWEGWLLVECLVATLLRSPQGHVWLTAALTLGPGWWCDFAVRKQALWLLPLPWICIYCGDKRPWAASEVFPAGSEVPQPGKVFAGCPWYHHATARPGVVSELSRRSPSFPTQFSPKLPKGEAHRSPCTRGSWEDRTRCALMIPGQRLEGEQQKSRA